MNLIALLVICPSFLLVTCATERHLKAKLYPSSTTKSQWSSFKFSNKRLYKNSSEETKRQVLIIFDCNRFTNFKMTLFNKNFYKLTFTSISIKFVFI